MIDIIIHHNADPDGNFSGAIALKANPEARTIGYNYEPDFSPIIEACAGKRVVMVDVSPHTWSDMHRLCETAESVVWIDHHPTALRQMEEAGTVAKYANFTPVFEHEKWGAAKKTYEYFFPKKGVPITIEMVAGYDVFREYGTDVWKDYYFPLRFAVNHLDTPQKVLDHFGLEIYEAALPKFLDSGRAIAQYLDDDNANLVSNPSLVTERTFHAGGKIYQVLTVNKGLFGDMFKSRDLTAFDFVVGFYCQTDAWKVSLRGAGKDIDLGAIARVFGGGGHKDAAGFSVATFEELRGVMPGLR